MRIGAGGGGIGEAFTVATAQPGLLVLAHCVRLHSAGLARQQVKDSRTV